MKGELAAWFQDSCQSEKHANLVAQSILGIKCEKVACYGWRVLDQELQENYIIGYMNQRKSCIAMSGNSSFMSVASCLVDATKKGLVNADSMQREIRSVIFLHEFRRFGVHVLNISKDQAHGLIQTNVNLDVDEFTSFFPMTVVNFPDELIESYESQNKLFYTMAFVRHDPEEGYLMIELHCKKKHDETLGTATMTFYPYKFNETYQTIQEKLEAEDTKQILIPQTIDAIKLTINAILLAQMNSNMVRLDDNKNHHLQRDFSRVMKGTGNFDKVKTATFWSFQPSLKTYNPSTSKSQNETGKNVKPHWRRGHWRRIVHGTKRSERKWMHFPAVFVNAQYFSGPMINTFTSHDMNNA